VEFLIFVLQTLYKTLLNNPDKWRENWTATLSKDYGELCTGTYSIGERLSNTGDPNTNSSHEHLPLFQILLPAGFINLNQVFHMIRCDENSCFVNLVGSGLVEIRTYMTKITLVWLCDGFWYK
jgi:hypothetical protein